MYSTGAVWLFRFVLFGSEKKNEIISIFRLGDLWAEIEKMVLAKIYDFFGFQW